MAGSPTSRQDMGHRGISWAEEGELLKSHKNELVIFF